jgi:hypothetical protein
MVLQMYKKSDLNWGGDRRGKPIGNIETGGTTWTALFPTIPDHRRQVEHLCDR